jgi:glutathione S-transferase
LFARAPDLYRRSMAFILYNAPQSTCSQRVRFVLNAKALPFEEIKLELLEGDQLKPDYLKLNPNGVVPTLVHDGAIVIDSAVIMEYLEEIESARFTPESPVERAAMRSMIRFIDEMPTPAVRVPTFNIAFLPRFQAMSEEEFVAFANSKPLRKEMMLRMGRRGFPDSDVKEAMDRLSRTIVRMDESFATSGGPWLMGKKLTLADIAIMPVIVRLADLGLDTLWTGRPAIARWLSAIRSHPAFKPTYYVGSLLTEKFPWLKERLAKRA